MLLALVVVSLIPTVVGPGFNTVTMLQVILPDALILGSIHVTVRASTISFVKGPETFVDVTVSVHEFALAMSSVVFPLANIFCTIGPLLLSEPVSKTSFPLARVHSARSVSVGLSLDSWLVESKYFSLAQCFFAFRLGEIFAGG